MNVEYSSWLVKPQMKWMAKYKHMTNVVGGKQSQATAGNTQRRIKLGIRLQKKRPHGPARADASSSWSTASAKLFGFLGSWWADLEGAVPMNKIKWRSWSLMDIGFGGWKSTGHRIHRRTVVRIRYIAKKLLCLLLA